MNILAYACSMLSPLAEIPNETPITEHLWFTQTSQKNLLNFFIVVSLQTYVTKFCLWKDYQPPDTGILLLFSAAISSVAQRNLDAFALPAVLPVTPPLFSALAAFFCILQGWQVGVAGKPWASEDTQVCSQQWLLWEAQA